MDGEWPSSSRIKRLCCGGSPCFGATAWKDRGGEDELETGGVRKGRSERVESTGDWWCKEKEMLEEGSQPAVRVGVMFGEKDVRVEGVWELGFQRPATPSCSGGNSP